MKRSHLIFLSLMALTLMSSQRAAFAQSGSVLDRVKSGGAIIIAHREASVPFSYFDEDKKPVGYAIDLCLRIAQAVGNKVGIKTVPLVFLPVTPANRIDTIAQGKADMECGGTTNNKERREKVSFTVPHFITGVRMLVKTSARVERLEDLTGKSIAVTKGSTAQKAIETAAKERLIGLKLVEVKDHTEAVAMVEKGFASAYMTDDVILFSLAATRADPKSLKVVGKFLTIEPLAIMLAKNDPEFKKIVDEEMKRLIRSREANAIYDKWFMQPIPPKNITLNLPTSYLLKDFWKYPTDVVPL